MTNWNFLDFPSLVLGAVLGALASTWFEFFLKRPVLKVTGHGGGGGPGPGFHTNHITISNLPGLFGVKLHETTILGFRVHGAMEKGIVVDRNPAHECRAHLYENQSGRFVKPLWWRLRDGALAQDVTLQSGQDAALMLFARRDDEPTKYFVFEPSNQNNQAPIVPGDDAKFQGTQKFTVRVMYSYGKKQLSIKCEMVRGFDGRLSFESENGGGSF